MRIWYAQIRMVPMSASDADFPSDLRALESEYELIRELGQGGMAAVYLARQRETGRLVAIKAIRARYLDDPDAIKRFAREARTVAGLDHPNIVRTEAIEQIDDRAVAIIMEHVPGGTVRDRLREHGSLGAEDAESILRDVANALGYAHRRGIVHRDVKPENVFLDPSRRPSRAVRLRHRAHASTATAASRCSAPRSARRSTCRPSRSTARWSTAAATSTASACSGWEMLTGRRPWAGESLYGIIYKQKHEDLPRITSLRPRVPANLLFAIEGALMKDKTAAMADDRRVPRPAHVQSAADALADVPAGSGARRRRSRRFISGRRNASDETRGDRRRRRSD